MNDRRRQMLGSLAGVSDLAVVLGSGLSGMVSHVNVERAIRYADIPDFPKPAVRGHPGRLLLCSMGRSRLLIFSGRFHLYEGGGMDRAGVIVALAAELGCRRILLTQAAGSLGRNLLPRSWMLPSDVMSLPPRELPRGPAPGVSGREPHRSPARLVSPRFRAEVGAAASRAAVQVYDGILFWTPGPAYETASEAVAASRLGADAASMSAMPELMAARRLGVEAACLSRITNHTCNVSRRRTDHGDVIRSGKRGIGELFMIITELIRHSSRSPVRAPCPE